MKFKLCKHNKSASKNFKKASSERIMHRGKTHSLWRKYMKVDFHISCSWNEKPHVRLMRHRLNKAGRTPSFVILDQDVNNVPPSKRTGNSRWGCTIVFLPVSPQHFLLMACVNKVLVWFLDKLTLRRASYWMERLIIGTQGAKWKDKGSIPESSHRTKQHCRSAKAFLGKHSSDGSCVTWKKVWESSKASTTWKAVMSTRVFDIRVLWGFTNKQRASEALCKGLTKNIWPHWVGLWKSPRKDCSVSKCNGIVWFFFTRLFIFWHGILNCNLLPVEQLCSKVTKLIFHINWRQWVHF